MIKISKIDAYAGLNKTDIQVIEEELDTLFHSDQRGNREMDDQFFLEDEKTIVLVVYWGGEEVELYRFQNNIGKVVR